jgi:hypothetical protein
MFSLFKKISDTNSWNVALMGDGGDHGYSCKPVCSNHVAIGGMEIRGLGGDWKTHGNTGVRGGQIVFFCNKAARD